MAKPTITLLFILGLAESSGILLYSIRLVDTSAVNASILGNGETIFPFLLDL
ncbi:MAG: hypothetical protein OEQ94_08445 [Nitrosopumilus sp.]|nr:hypothetical protein [Nitrosopumilus sp.]MDH3823495.1 hypothetical protein [Nitrosopumilus sp.]MDH3834323.1 hypothetical protein [Nitrosopumilus sp.]